MTPLEALKQDILKDYDEWMELAFQGLNDTMNLREVANNNFKQKIDNLIKLVEDGKDGPSN